MSSASEQPRQREILIAAVETLRRDDTLVGWLYPDREVPTDPVDRLRIHDHDPGFEANPPAQIAIAAAGSGGTYRGGQMSHSYIVQVTIRVSDDYYERYTSTRLLAIHDRCGELFDTSAIAPGVMPGGPAGSGNAHETRSGTYDRVVVGQWRFETHWTTRWP